MYGFWGSLLWREALAAETDLVLNLASREYSRAVAASPAGIACACSPAPSAELESGRVVEKGTLCKMARGEMVRWMAQTCDHLSGGI